VLITSAARVDRATTFTIRVAPSAHAKCQRCWHWRADVGADVAHPALCGRCVANLFGAGEPRRFA
jgi:isoleucyl-tRNA synthetase